MVPDNLPNVKEEVFNPGSITTNDRPWTNTTAWHNIENTIIQKTILQQQPRANTTFKMSGRHRDL